VYISLKCYAVLETSGAVLLQGVFHGVTGVVTKPIEGAKQEGVGGFFKGAAV